jgi:hypothetical protein
MAKKQAVQKADQAGVMSAARELVANLQQQAKDGEIDGAMLDQLSGMLDVSFDENDVSGTQSTMAGDASQATMAPSMPAPSVGSEEPGTPTPSEAVPSTPSYSDEDDETIPSKPSGVHKMNKAAEPFATRPPSPAFIFDHVDEMQAQLPTFISHLESGSLRKAQKLAGNQQAFDTMFNLAMRAVMTEGGITYRNISKMHGGAPESMDLSKAMTASDVPGIYLIRLAKLMLPVYAGLRRRLPADTPKTGAENATWRAQIGFGTLNFADLMSVAEAAIGTSVPSSFLTFNSPYKDTSLNDAVTLKAIAAARGYDDPLQIAVIRAMTALLQAEERNILGGNGAALADTTAVTASGSSSGGTIAAGSYVVTVTALSYRGWLAKSKGSGSAVGESVGTASTQQVVSGGTNSIAVTWPAVPGAVAYNVYLTTTGGAGSAARYNKTVLVNKATLTIASTSTNTPPTADTTVNTNMFEGLIQWCTQATILGNAIPSKQTITDNAGAGLTTGKGGITQFDAILNSLWTNWQTAPSLMVMSPSMSGTVTDKLLALNSAALYRIELTNERGQMQGGAMATGYVNKFAPYADGTPRYIDILPHPYMPDGTILFATETIPNPMSRESRGFALDVLIPYTYFPLAQTTIQYPFALTLSESVECFHPSAQTALTGVDVDL